MKKYIIGLVVIVIIVIVVLIVQYSNTGTDSDKLMIKYSPEVTAVATTSMEVSNEDMAAAVAIRSSGVSGAIWDAAIADSKGNWVGTKSYSAWVGGKWVVFMTVTKIRQGEKAIVIPNTSVAPKNSTIIIQDPKKSTGVK